MIAGLDYVVTSVVTFIVVLGLLVLGHEFGHFLTARLFHIRVLEFGIGFPPRAKVLGHDHETEYTLNYLPIGGFVKLEGEDADSDDPRAFGNAPLIRQLIVLVAGVTMNVLFAFVLFFFVAWFANPTANARIDGFTAASPAQAAGLHVGDTIETINGRSFAILPSAGDPSQALITDLRTRAGQTVTLGIATASGGHENVPVKLRQPDATHPGTLGVELTISLGYSSSSPVASVGTAAASTTNSLGLILAGLGQLGSHIVSNPTQAPAGVEGPVGIAQTMGSVVQNLGFVYLLILTAILSANLALVNILPFPPLDGGRMAVLLVKRVAGKRGVSTLEATSYLVGFALLLAFIVWISYFDIVRIGTGQ